MLDYNGTRIRRNTRSAPCLVCGGHDGLPRGAGRRCHGFRSSDGRYQHCTREELAAGLPVEINGTYGHRLDGTCRCGVVHAASLARALAPRPATSNLAPPPLPRVVATYDYRDADGALLYQVCRFDPKQFRQRRPGVDGGWVWSMRDVDLVLYGLPELRRRPADRVYLVEGEKDAEALLGINLLATTAAMGAAGPWREGYTAALRGRDVVIVVDSDDAGRRRGERLVRTLASAAARLRVVDLAPERHDGYDAADWLAAGHTRAELERRGPR